LTGIIVKGIGGFYYVKTADGALFETKARGIFRKFSGFFGRLWGDLTKETARPAPKTQTYGTDRGLRAQITTPSHPSGRRFPHLLLRCDSEAQGTTNFRFSSVFGTPNGSEHSSRGTEHCEPRVSPLSFHLLAVLCVLFFPITVYHSYALLSRENVNFVAL